MVSFDLTPADKKIIEMAHEQAIIYRRYAPQFDHDIKVGDPPPVIPEEEEFPHVRDIARQTDGTSGFAILDALINLEEVWGTKPVRHRGRDGDTMNFFLSNSVLKLIGDPEQIEYFDKFCLCYGVTEPGAGSDPAQVRTMAVQDPETRDWVINGEKVFISMGEAADAVMILARARAADGTEKLSNFMIEKGTPGFTIAAQHRKMGLRVADTTHLVFQDVRIPDFNHLNGSLKSTLSILNSTRSMVAVQALGYSRAVLDFLREKLAENNRSVDYISGIRRQSAISAALLRLEALYDAVWLMVLRAKWTEREKGEASILEASGSKALAGRLVRAATQEVIDILGPEAISEDYHVERFFRDGRIVDIYEGAGEIQRILIVRKLLGYTPREFN